MAARSIRVPGPALLVFVALCAGCNSEDDASATPGSGAGAAAGGGTSAAASGASATSSGGVGAVAGSGAGTTAGSGGEAASGGGGGTTAGTGAGSVFDGGGNPEVDAAADAAIDGGSTARGPITLYYLDVTQARVMSVDAEGDEPDVVVESAGQGPDGVAVDASSGHIYWTNMGVASQDDGFILRSDLDGSNVTTIVDKGGTHTPKQLKVESSTGKLYWGDREGMRIQRCNLDGSELETLVTIAQGAQARADRANHAVGVSVDTVGGYVYWVQKGPPNGGEGSIRRAALEIPDGETHENRSDIEVLYANLPEPIDLDVDVEAGMMYWSDRGDATINRAPIEIPSGATASTRHDREILVEGVTVAIGVSLDLPGGHVYYTGNDVVGRANLDGSDNTTLVSNAGVLTGITAVRLP